MVRHIVRGVDAFVTGSISYAPMVESDVPDRIRTTLPTHAADRIESEMDVADRWELPAGALEYRALELASKGAQGTTIVEDVAAFHRALQYARVALQLGRPTPPADDEIEAAGAMLRRGISAHAVRMLAASAPIGRSLTVPLRAVISLMDRGLPASDVIDAMQVWLAGDASDEELLDLAGPKPQPGLTVVR